MRSLAIRLLLYAFVAFPLPSWAGSEHGGACGAPDDLVTTDTPLAQFAAAVAAGGPVNVLAVGSATTVGSSSVGGEQTHVTNQNNAYPWQMVQALHAALPSVEFHLTVRGGRGMTAEDMLPLLQEALKAQRYPLVI